MISEPEKLRRWCLMVLDARNTWSLHRDGFLIVYDAGRLVVDSCALASKCPNFLACMVHPTTQTGNVWDDIFEESKRAQSDLGPIMEQLKLWLPLEALAEIE